MAPVGAPPGRTGLLLREGYRVVGVERRAIKRNSERLDELGITDALEFADLGLADSGSIVGVHERIDLEEV